MPAARCHRCYKPKQATKKLALRKGRDRCPWCHLFWIMLYSAIPLTRPSFEW